MEEERYKDVLKDIIEIIKNTEHSDIGFASICTYIGDHCPELKESAGEKIRKALIDYFEGWQTRAIDENAAYYKDIAIKDILAWLEKQGKCETDCPQNHQDVNHPNGCITMEDFSGGEGFYKLNIEYLNKRQVEEIEEIIRTWNKDADCKLCTSKKHCISIEKQDEMDIEKPITIGKRRAVSGKLKELIDNKDPKSIEETKEKMLEETSKWTEEDERLFNSVYNTLEGIAPLSYEKEVEWLKSIKERLL